MAVSGMDFGNGEQKRKEVQPEAQPQSQSQPQVVYVEAPARKKSGGFLKVVGVVFIVLIVLGALSTMGRRSINERNEATRSVARETATPVSEPTSDGSGAQSVSDSQTSANAPAEPEKPETASQGEGQDFAVSIDDAHVGADITDSPCLIVDYTFTNVSKERGMSFVEVGDKAYQNGVECTPTIFAGADSEGNEYRELKPGASISVSVAYTLVDTTTPVDIEVTGSYFSSDVVAARTFTL